jgi:hypothetical protein
MAKKNNDLWYILGGVIILILMIVIISLQVQNSERQKELQKQQENLHFQVDTQKCISSCTTKWNSEQDSCEEKYNLYRNNGWMPSPTDSNILDCSNSLPTTEIGYACQCECLCAGFTSNFLIQ